MTSSLPSSLHSASATPVIIIAVITALYKFFINFSNRNFHVFKLIVLDRLFGRPLASNWTRFWRLSPRFLLCRYYYLCLALLTPLWGSQLLQQRWCWPDWVWEISCSRDLCLRWLLLLCLSNLSIRSAKLSPYQSFTRRYTLHAVLSCCHLFIATTPLSTVTGIQGILRPALYPQLRIANWVCLSWYIAAIPLSCYTLLPLGSANTLSFWYIHAVACVQSSLSTAATDASMLWSKPGMFLTCLKLSPWLFCFSFSTLDLRIQLFWLTIHGFIIARSLQMSVSLLFPDQKK